MTEIIFGTPEHISGLSRKALEEDFRWVNGRRMELEGECERLDAENAKLREQMERLVTLLRNDCDIDASWDGLRGFWLIGLTENGCLMRDRACKAEVENAKLWEQLERVQPTDCEGNVLDIADTVHMLRSEYDGDHEWEDVVTELVLTKWGGDRWIVRGSKGEAWACDCAKTGYDEDAYEASDDVEPFGEPTLLEAENAKLREEVEQWHRLTAGIELPEYPITEFKPKDLERENDKLRELVTGIGHLLFSLDVDYCVACPRDDINHPCPVHTVNGGECLIKSELRELGVEVDE